MKFVFKILALFLLITFLNVQVAKAYYMPIFAIITSGHCYTCQQLKPVVEELKSEYEDQVTFLTFDLSSKSSLDEARQMAEEYGILEFFEANKNALPKVGIICPGATTTDRIYTGEIRKEVYTEILEKLLIDTSAICSL